ncbi:MAG: EamA family transporter [Alphaproteobacteria bacterium]|nr:EamA family transporter [Alphaproteobacteria bacterium]
MTGRTLAGFILVTLIWGSTWLVIKTQLGIVPPGWSVAYRFLVAGLALLAFCVATGKSLRLGRQGHLFAMAMGVFQFAANFNLVYAAEQHVTSGLVAVAFALLIVPNALLAWAALGHRVTPRFAAGSVVGMAGVALLFWREIAGAPMGGQVALGLAMTLGSILCASIANVMQATPLAQRLPPHGLLATGFLYGAAINVGLAWVQYGPPVIDPSPGYLGGVFYLAIVASCVAFLVYYEIIRDIGPAKAAYSSLLTPFIAMALSTAFEGYQWTIEAALGGVLAIAGLWVALTSRRA